MGRTCHLTPVPPDLLVTFSFSVFKRRMTLSNTSPLCFTHLFSSSNMWCVYKCTYTHMPVYFNFEIWDSCAWVIGRGLLRYVFDLYQPGWFFSLFFSHQGIARTMVTWRKIVQPLSPLPSFLSPLSLNAFLVLKQGLVMALVFKWPSYVISAFHLFLNDYQFPFVYLNQGSLSSCCLKHLRLGSFAEFSSWWN